VEVEGRHGGGGAATEGTASASFRARCACSCNLQPRDTATGGRLKRQFSSACDGRFRAGGPTCRSLRFPGLQALPLLQSRFPIERARMRLKLTVPLSSREELLELVGRQGGQVEEQDLAGECACVCVCVPVSGGGGETHLGTGW
jgi:hypothetical protein